MRVISTSAIGIVNTGEQSRYLLDQWNEKDRNFFLETQRASKYYLSDLNFEKQKNGHLVMIGVLHNIPGTEITFMHQGQMVTIQLMVSGMIGQPVVDLLKQLRDSLIF